MSNYRILSLDGGGIRGLLTTVLLARLEEAQPGFLAQIDLFAGTSTGGILALGLASGMTPAECQTLYEVHGQAIFSNPIAREVADLGNIVGAKYANASLKQALVDQFHDKTLADLPRKVLISSFALNSTPNDLGALRAWKPKFFHNYPGPDSDAKERVLEVALRTSAAPTYFPMFQEFVDGGVIANNPSMCALAQALHASTGGQKLDDIRLLSLGTGLRPKFLAVKDANWGLVEWAPHLVDLLLEGSNGLGDYQCRQTLGDNYCRLNPMLPNEITLDDVVSMPLLKQLGAEADLADAINWLKTRF